MRSALSLWKKVAEQVTLLVLQHEPGDSTLAWEHSVWLWRPLKQKNVGLVLSLEKPVERPMLTWVFLRNKPNKVCTDLVPDASPTHGSANEHVCTRLVQLWESSKGAIHPRRNIHKLISASTVNFHTAAICSVGLLQRREHQMCPCRPGLWVVHTCSLGTGMELLYVGFLWVYFVKVLIRLFRSGA